MEFQELFRLAMKRNVPQIRDMPDEGLILNLGSGKNPIIGAINLDLPNWDAEREPIPFDDETVHGIHAYHFLEHLSNPIGMLQECQRVLRPGGVMNICVPYYNSQLMAQDLTHKHAFSETTWQNLFRNKYYRRGEWKLYESFNLICGIVERNMVLLTQLVREEY